MTPAPTEQRLGANAMKEQNLNAGTVVGSVAALWRFPVKSMQGEQLDAADVSAAGLVGDRAYAVLDLQTGKVASATHPKLWPGLLASRATLIESPRPGGEPPAASIELADGTAVISDAPDIDVVLSRFFGREVTLARAAPPDFTIDQYHPDIENLDPEGHRNELIEQRLGTALFNELGAPSAVPEGSFMDAFPVSVIATSSLDHLAELQPESRFDVRRFRMNVIVETAEPGFIENGWVGRTLQIGRRLRLGVTMPDPRCVMTTVEQPGLPRDPEILRGLVKHNRLEIKDFGGRYPCVGVYAVVASPGAVRRGDPVLVV
jgi:MOSC domain-containing protein